MEFHENDIGFHEVSYERFRGSGFRVQGSGFKVWRFRGPMAERKVHRVKVLGAVGSLWCQVSGTLLNFSKSLTWTGRENGHKGIKTQSKTVC